jgi:hypothetical protein
MARWQWSRRSAGLGSFELFLFAVVKMGAGSSSPSCQPKSIEVVLALPVCAVLFFGVFYVGCAMIAVRGDRCGIIVSARSVRQLFDRNIKIFAREPYHPW